MKLGHLSFYEIAAYLAWCKGSVTQALIRMSAALCGAFSSSMATHQAQPSVALPAQALAQAAPGLPHPATATTPRAPHLAPLACRSSNDLGKDGGTAVAGALERLTALTSLYLG